MKTFNCAATALAFSLGLTPVVALAQTNTVHGEVKKIDTSAGKITLKHGPITNLDKTEPSKTMVIRVKDPAILKKVAVGDKVTFEADRVGGNITVTEIQKAK